MAPELLTLNPTEDARVELKSYNETIPMGSLAIGVDNIHHDVFLSPKFVQSAKDYLFDLIKQGTKAKYFPGIELLRLSRQHQRHGDDACTRGDTGRQMNIVNLGQPGRGVGARRAAQVSPIGQRR